MKEEKFFEVVRFETEPVCIYKGLRLCSVSILYVLALDGGFIEGKTKLPSCIRIFHFRCFPH